MKSGCQLREYSRFWRVKGTCGKVVNARVTATRTSSNAVNAQREFLQTCTKLQVWLFQVYTCVVELQKGLVTEVAETVKIRATVGQVVKPRRRQIVRHSSGQRRTMALKNTKPLLMTVAGEKN